MEGIPARGPYVLSKKVSERVRGWTLKLTETLMSWTPREWQFSILLWCEHKISFGNYPRIVQCQWEILLMLTLNNGCEHYLTMFSRLEMEVRIISCFSVSSSFFTINCLLTGTPSAPGRRGDNRFGSLRGVRWLPVKLNVLNHEYSCTNCRFNWFKISIKAY